nr:hypothetical protein 14 [Pseudomonadaceae bacterium]
MIAAAGIAKTVGRFLIGRPGLALGIAALVGVLYWREQAHDAESELLQLQADSAAAVIDAQELNAERRVQFMNQQAERLEQRNRDLARRNRAAEASLSELSKINQAADALVKSKWKQLDELKAEYAVLSERVPDSVVRLLSTKNPHDTGGSGGVRGGTGPR